MNEFVRDCPRVCIVGSGISGYRAARQILRSYDNVEVVVIGEELYPTYSRPGLSKGILLDLDEGTADLAAQLSVPNLTDSRLQWRLGRRVLSAHLSGRELCLDSGERLEYDVLVIASGVRPRESGFAATRCGRHEHRVLRDVGDAAALHHALRKGRRVVVRGNGFIACEMASLAIAFGCEVSMVESRSGAPLRRVVGERLAASIRERMRAYGVSFRDVESLVDSCSDRVAPAAMTGSGSGVRERALMLEAIGSVPNVEWLSGNGIDVSDGVLVDGDLRCRAYEGVFAAGDVARYSCACAKRATSRAELWGSAVTSGDAAGSSVVDFLGGRARRKSLSHIHLATTEVFGLRVQTMGNVASSDTSEVAVGDVDDLESGVLMRFYASCELVGVVCVAPGGELTQRFQKEAAALQQKCR